MTRWLPKRRFLTAALSLLAVLGILFWRWNELARRWAAGTLDDFYAENAQESPWSAAIQEFLQRPVRSYDEAVILNSASCPTEGVNFDTASVRGNEAKWQNISANQISTWRSEMAAYLEERWQSGGEKGGRGDEYTDAPGGRGIVMAAGDAQAAIRARTNIRLLRSYNCTLAVEIFHFEGELAGPERRLLEEILAPEVAGGHGDRSPVRLRLVKGVVKGNDWKAFQIKGAALQQSSFDEILYLDTDSYPLRNPESLFESKQWEETGLLLWPDFTKSHATNPLWRLLGQPCRDEYEAESGQIAISRSRHQDLLWLVEYFARRYQEFYGFMGGDRDSFRAAALLLGKRWNGPARLIAAAGSASDDAAEVRGHTMLQAGLDGSWMFVHANLIKHARFPRPLWKQISRAANDRFEGGTYGNIDPPNDRIGKGVKLRVHQESRMETIMEPFEGYDKALVVVEDWDAYEELRGFEERWFRLGGVR